MYSGLVLVRYSKTYSHGHGCPKGRNLYSKIPGNRRHVTPSGATCRSTRVCLLYTSDAADEDSPV